MNHELFDFLDELRVAHTTEQAGQSFITFAQRTGATVVHTFFGGQIEHQSVSTIPKDYITAEMGAPANKDEYVPKSIKAGVPRVVWGIDLDPLNPDMDEGSRVNNAQRYHDLRQRSAITMSMPNRDRTYNGAGVGIGFDDKGDVFLKRMDENGGAFAVAAFAAYQSMLMFSDHDKEPSPLSPRQAEILQLLASGERLGEIADTLKISNSAVNQYLATLRVKLGVRTKEEALAKAVMNGWIIP